MKLYLIRNSVLRSKSSKSLLGHGFGIVDFGIVFFSLSALIFASIKLFRKDQIEKKAELALSKARHHANAKWNQRQACEVSLGEVNEFKVLPIVSLAGSRVEVLRSLLEFSTGIQTTSVFVSNTEIHRDHVLEGRALAIQTENMTFKNMHRRTDACIWLIRDVKAAMLEGYLRKYLTDSEVSDSSFISSTAPYQSQDTFDSYITDEHFTQKLDLLLVDNLAWKAYKARALADFEATSLEVKKYCPNVKVLFYEELLVNRERLAKFVHVSCSFLNSHNKLFIPFHKDCLKKGLGESGIFGKELRSDVGFEEAVRKHFSASDKQTYRTTLARVNATWEGILPKDYLSWE